MAVSLATTADVAEKKIKEAFPRSGAGLVTLLALVAEALRLFVRDCGDEADQDAIAARMKDDEAHVRSAVNAAVDVAIRRTQAEVKSDLRKVIVDAFVGQAAQVEPEDVEGELLDFGGFGAEPGAPPEIDVPLSPVQRAQLDSLLIDGYVVAHQYELGSATRGDARKVASSVKKVFGGKWCPGLQAVGDAIDQAEEHEIPRALRQLIRACEAKDEDDAGRDS